MTQFSMQPELSNRKRSIILRLCIWAGVVGPILFTLVFTIDGLLKPGYSAMSQAVSYLAVGSNGWIQDANFMVLGLLLTLFALGFSQWMRPVIKQSQLLVSTIFLLSAALGYVGAALFIAAAPDESQNVMHVVLHTISFQVIFFSLPIACIIIGWQLRKIVAWSGYGWYSIITACITIIPALFSVASFFSAAGTQSLGGFFNRIFVIEALAWYVVMGSRMLILERDKVKASR
ncbi:MAG: hypothetical protein NVS4B7_19370 [Ktedonobacteraceae bacterium]